ncbi:MAG TPA: SDR family oxidoreductase [bacterium]|nr:SDR family oxidoreductase [bacterium]HPG44703.1 SDR family oxidoreductase [bacterium]HPM99390.1 SDR family oxidoreductase [bacterium]
MKEHKTDSCYALILGASSGFGAAAALRLAHEGYHIFGVHLDRKSTQPQVEELIVKIKTAGGCATYFNINAADGKKRAEVVAEIRKKIPRGQHIKVMLHSLAFGSLKLFIDKDASKCIAPDNVAMTMNVMAHSLIYWAQELFWQNLLGYGSRIFAMTSHGSHTVLPYYGAVSAAKAALEAHIRQLALELGPIGVTCNALKAGVTNTPALQKIPGYEAMIEATLRRNPAGRLTTPADVANAIASLCSMDVQWINGDTIAIDYGESVMDRG